MRMNLLLVATLVLTTSLLGCKSKEQQEADNAVKKAELDKLQGKWKVVSKEGDTDEEDESPEPGSYYIIDGDIMKMVYKDREGKENEFQRQKLTLTTDRDPKQIDLTYLDESNKPIKSKKIKKGITGKKKVSTTDLKDVAVYKVEGDKLTFSISWDDKKRPSGFLNTKGSSSYLLVLQKMMANEETVVNPEKDRKAIKDGKDAKDGKDKAILPKESSKADSPKADAPKADAPK